MPAVRAIYKCTQDELYAISNIAFNNLEADRAAFALKKAKYTLPFVTTLRGLRTAAMALPGEDSISSTHEVLENLLGPLVVPVKDNFNDLKGYIRDAWPTEDPMPRYEAAGLNEYNKIGVDNWEKVVGLNEAMDLFINDPANNTLLGTPGGMPGTFAAKVTTDTTNFDAVYNPFMVARESSSVTAAKITANNNLHTAMMDMMEDGTGMVFRTNADMKKRYVFTTIKDLVSPPGSASLTVEVITDGTNAPVPNQAVTIQAEGGLLISGTTNAQGLVPYVNIDPAKYTVKTGNLTLAKEVNTGVNARLKITLPTP